MKTIVLLAALSMSLLASAQTKIVSLNGIVRDTADHTGLQHAVIYLKDRVKPSLLTYTRSDSSGRFVINNLPSDTFVMVVTYPGYVDWIDTVVAGNKFIHVNLITQARLLQEVMVTAPKTPMRIKGDTTEFFADYFQLKPGATVEDLLRILPGMSVNSKGHITLHGQRVQQVLVDGEEFFGNDPTMATQNLDKNDISKVQVYDRKSDKAMNTGIDDGKRQKTINLVLKEDAKKGYFGELLGGTDFQKYYQGKGMIARFTSRLKAGALVITDRTGRDVAGFQEGSDFGLVSSGRDGIPETIQAAAMINKTFGALQSSTVNNAAFNHFNVIGESYTGIKYILPDTVYYNKQVSTNNTTAWQQGINSRNEFKIDSLTTLTVNARLGFGKTNNASTLSGQYLASDNITPINESKQTNLLSGDQSNGIADIYFKKLLNKSGSRFFVINASHSENANESEAYLYNSTTFYSNGTSVSQSVDQQKISSFRSRTSQALLSYVMPLRKNLSLNLNYTLHADRSGQNIQSFDNRNGKYDSLNLLFSNHYNFASTSHRVGASLSWTGKKATADLGFAAQDIKMKQLNLYTDSTMIRNFVNVFPVARIHYKYSNAGSLTFAYNGRTQQPTFWQLQPVLNNTDPLNIQIGNPELKPAFYHSFDFQLGEYKAVTGRSIRVGALFTTATNDFNTLSQIDNQGRRIYQTINVNGNHSYRAWFSYGRNLKLLNLNVSLQPQIYGDRYNNYINGLRNTTKVFSFTPNLWISGYFNKKLDIQTSYNVEFRHTVSSINPGISTNYKLFGIYAHVDYAPGNGWKFLTGYSYNVREKLSANDRNNDAMIWNIVVEKKISTKENIAAIVRVNDVLNQGIGFNRTISSTSVTENSFMTIQRYILFALRWRFNKDRNL